MKREFLCYLKVRSEYEELIIETLGAEEGQVIFKNLLTSKLAEKAVNCNPLNTYS